MSMSARFRLPAKPRLAPPGLATPRRATPCHVALEETTGFEYPRMPAPSTDRSCQLGERT
jgi:hypothetical protein